MRSLSIIFCAVLVLLSLQPEATCMDKVRIFTGADTAHACGFDGSGIIGEVRAEGFDQGHPDFAGQIAGIDGDDISFQPHGTCIFGIIFSSGANNAQAKGMLPNTGGVFCDWGVNRLFSIVNLHDQWGGVFQSNVWVQGNPNGEYTSRSRESDMCVFLFDKITVLWPAGNDGNDGSSSLSPDPVAKNVVTVGALNHYNDINMTNDEWGPHPGGVIGRPSYGPAADGRIKPDLCGPFDDVYTTDNRDGFGSDGFRIGNYVTTSGDRYYGGTAAAAAVVAGATGIVYQMYKENFFGNNPSGQTPHASTVKALLIVDAYQYEFFQATRYQQGWGLPDLRTTLEIGNRHFIVDEETALQTGELVQYPFTPEEGSPLKISLVWTDFPAMSGADPALVNDLNLKVTAPDATVYWGNYGLESSHWSTSGGVADSLNNVENVFIENPQPGQWTIEVIAVNIAQDGHSETPYTVDQDFALVATTIPAYICGDTNGDGVIDLGDVLFLISYLYKGGPAPDPFESGDVDCSGEIELGDVLYLISYLYKGGPAPDCP